MEIPRPVFDHVRSATRPAASPDPWCVLAPGDVLAKDGKAYRAGVELNASACAVAAAAWDLIHTPNAEWAVVEDYQRYSPSATDLKVMLFGTVQALKPGQPEGGETQAACACRGHWSWSFAVDAN
jgi:hypothetical protein